jgi:DNA-directed RNA polymerase specialized sigma24 family protein
MRLRPLSMLIPLPSRIAARAPGRRHGHPAPDTVQDAWGALMAAAQDGNGGAYRRLLGEVSAWLQRYFQRRLPYAEVDDAIQETLLAIHGRRHTYDPRYPFGPWLAAIAKRKWIDQLRGLERRFAEDLTDDLSVPDHEAAVTSATVLASLIEAGHHNGQAAGLQHR